MPPYYNIKMALTAMERKQRYKERHPERVKEQAHRYYINNLEHSKEIRAKWETENAEYRKEQKAERVICDCGSNVRRGEYSKHCKSQKHKKYEQEHQDQPIETIQEKLLRMTIYTPELKQT